MDNINGALAFKATLDINDFNVSAQAMERSIKQVSSTAVSESDGYRLLIPVIDGKMLVRYTGTFSIFDNDDKDKKLASERLLYYMVAQDDFEDGEIQNYPLVLSSNGLEAISGQRSLEKMIKEIQTPCIMLNTNDGKINEK